MLLLFASAPISAIPDLVDKVQQVCNVCRVGRNNCASYDASRGVEWKAFPGMYSSGFVGGDSTVYSLQAAKSKCLGLGHPGVCKAVTCAPAASEQCTIRGSYVLSPGSVTVTSYRLGPSYTPPPCERPRLCAELSRNADVAALTHVFEAVRAMPLLSRHHCQMAMGQLPPSPAPPPPPSPPPPLPPFSFSLINDLLAQWHVVTIPSAHGSEVVNEGPLITVPAHRTLWLKSGARLVASAGTQAARHHTHPTCSTCSLYSLHILYMLSILAPHTLLALHTHSTYSTCSPYSPYTHLTYSTCSPYSLHIYSTCSPYSLSILHLHCSLHNRHHEFRRRHDHTRQRHNSICRVRHLLCGMDVGYMWNGCGMDVGWMWDICGIYVGYMWDICGIYVGWMWDGCGMDVGWMWDHTSLIYLVI